MPDCPVRFFKQGEKMKIAFAGKGGVGKTTLAAWTANYLARQEKMSGLLMRILPCR